MCIPSALLAAGTARDYTVCTWRSTRMFARPRRSIPRHIRYRHTWSDPWPGCTSPTGTRRMLPQQTRFGRTCRTFRAGRLAPGTRSARSLVCTFLEHTQRMWLSLRMSARLRHTCRGYTRCPYTALPARPRRCTFLKHRKYTARHLVSSAQRGRSSPRNRHGRCRPFPQTPAGTCPTRTACRRRRLRTPAEPAQMLRGHRQFQRTRFYPSLPCTDPIRSSRMPTEPFPPQTSPSRTPRRRTCPVHSRSVPLGMPGTRAGPQYSRTARQRTECSRSDPFGPGTSRVCTVCKSRWRWRGGGGGEEGAECEKGNVYVHPRAPPQTFVSSS